MIIIGIIVILITCFLAATIFFWPLPLPASTVATAVAILPVHHPHHLGAQDHHCDEGDDDGVCNVYLV